jgi:predicted nucleic acid-binding protein
MRIYLDCCCLNRPFDDRSQDRVRIEIAALEIIMERVANGTWILLGSDVLAAELEEIPDPERRHAVTALLLHAKEWIVTSPEVVDLASEFTAAGIDAMDALHLASATVGEADAFLTVDTRLYKRAQRVHDPKPVATFLPAIWLEGLTKESSS